MTHPGFLQLVKGRGQEDRMVWGSYAVKIEVQMGICFCY